MSRMLKTQLPSQAIVWMAPVVNTMYPHRWRSEDVWYLLRMYEPYARTTGAAMKDRPPIELLNTMGIKVHDKGPYPADRNQQYAHTWIRYTVIGCRYVEITKDNLDAQGHAINPMVLEFLKESKKVTNSDVEALMPLYDELIPAMNGINEGIVLPSTEEEEGWIYLR